MKTVIDLAIVTSCHNYGKYLGDWAKTLVGMTTWPKRVALVDNGSTDGTWAQMNAAADLLRKAGLDVLVERIPLTDFGSARNAAVALGGDAEWIMHMDADDTFMSHCLDEVAKLMPKADVIPLGYERSGDLAAGPRNKTRVYSSSQGKTTLKSSAPASGVSPFRRSLWEKSPYRTDMIGGWDTALWIGFAHLNARFIAVRRPCFYYRQHADSVFNTRRLNKYKGRLVGSKLVNLRVPRRGVSLLVPRQGDNGGHRDRTWAWVRSYYERTYPEWEIVEGFCDARSGWRKGVAVQNAYEKSVGETIIIADSDCVLPKESLQEAVRLVEEKQAPWVVPHTLVKRLDQKTTEAVLQGDLAGSPPWPENLARAAYNGFAGGGFIVIDASFWRASGGIPPAFVGWGAEDEAVAVILDTMIGPHVRLPYDLWHLWHPSARKGNRTSETANRMLYRAILSFAGDPEGMTEIVERMSIGASYDQIMKSSRGQGVTMVALMDFKRGTEIIKKGDPFVATEEEAKRHEARPRKIAMRASGAVAAQIGLSRYQTLAIRSEQHVRNTAANAARDAKLNSVTITGA